MTTSKPVTTRFLWTQNIARAFDFPINDPELGCVAFECNLFLYFLDETAGNVARDVGWNVPLNTLLNAQR